LWQLQSRCVKSAAARKRKAVSNEVDELKRRKIKIEGDKKSLLKAADNYAEEAEHLHRITSLIIHGWQFGVAVMRWSQSTQLLYIEPG